MTTNYGHVLNPHTRNLSLLPRKRLPKSNVRAWLTCADRSCLHKPVSMAALKPKIPEIAIKNIVVLDPTISYQTMLGVGGTMIDSDIYNLQRLSPAKRKRAIADLMTPNGLGFNLMRIAFGSTDWNRDWDFYTYCDRPAGQTDPKLEHFSIQRDIDRGTLDIIRECLAANPDMRILASVWGLPAWMKTNDSIIHGFFDSRYTEVYARYLIRCIQAYEAQGIPIHYITTQNEPATAADRDTPATMWTWQQQRDITIELKRILTSRRMKTKIWLHDHNFDMAMNYVRPMLEDLDVRRAVAGVAWHDYSGHPEDMALLHSLYPKLPAILTERNRGRLVDFGRVIEILRCGAIGHISWTTITDSRGGPHQYDGGSESRPPADDPLRCGNILVVPESTPATCVKPLPYYCYQQMSSHIARGAKRILSNRFVNETVSSIAFVQPNGDLLFLATNPGDTALDFALQLADAALPLHLPAESMLTVQLPQC